MRIHQIVQPSGELMVQKLLRFFRKLFARARTKALPESKTLNMHVVFSDGSVMIEVISVDDFAKAKSSPGWTTATNWLEQRYFGLGVNRVEISFGNYVILTESKDNVKQA